MARASAHDRAEVRAGRGSALDRAEVAADRKAARKKRAIKGTGKYRKSTARSMPKRRSTPRARTGR